MKNNNLNIKPEDMMEQAVIKLMRVRDLSRADAEAALSLAQEALEAACDTEEEVNAITIAQIYTMAVDMEAR